MGDSSTESQSFLKRHLEGFKDFWAERFSFLEDYTRFIKEPVPRWSSSDVEEFIASDSVHGPALRAAREAAKYAAAGSVIGAVTTAGFTWKYSRSLHGAGLSFVAGAVFGWTFGQEIASHSMQLYRLDTRTAEVKFMEWWERKCGRQS